MDRLIQLVIQSELPKSDNEYLTLLTDKLSEKEQLQNVLIDYLRMSLEEVSDITGLPLDKLKQL